ncbi:hypothetical protein SAMN05421788_104433 [Filimonas lacunae]|uniref:Chain length determinant protein n=1 Tax=Filimonas lacunae TaxID=477680 RepID=A0A173MRS4_9BACT|nr:hypothetical protein [Filimonas lacunae]BAV10197.1 lipopolysaccharide biosynthesis protein [Filimonas lacunae]SIT18364.1 hypothetical protein SAMN05421788_104433 [Filimonas lacunae]
MSEKPGEMSLKELFGKINSIRKYLFSKWLIIGVIGFMGAVIGFVYALNKKPSYKGTLTFVLSGGSKQSGGLASLAGQFGFDVGGGGSNGAFEGENILELLKSKRIIKGALFYTVPERKNVLLNVIGEDGGFFNRWKNVPRIKTLVPFSQKATDITPIQDSLIGEMCDFLNRDFLLISKVDKKLSFYSVSTTSPYEIISVYLTKSVVQEAAKMYIDTKTKTAKDNLEMLQHEADSLRGRLSGTIYSTASIADQTFNLNSALQVQRVPIQQNQIQAQVLSAAYVEVVKNLEVAKISLQREMPLYQIIDEPGLPLTRVRMSKMKMALSLGIVFSILASVVLVVRKILQSVIA